MGHAYENRFIAHVTSALGCTFSEGRRARPEAGGDVYWALMTPSNPRGLVVSFHATGNDAWFGQLHLFAALLAKGFAIYTFDLDGHGWRSSARLVATNAASMAQAAINHAQSFNANAPRTILLAQSVGAAIAASLSNHQSHNISAAVLLGAMHEPHIRANSVVAELASPLCRGWWDAGKFYGAYERVPAFGPFKRSQFPIRIGHSGAYAYIDVVKEIFSRADQTVYAKMKALSVVGAWDMLAKAAPLTGITKHVEVAANNHYTTPFDRTCAQTITAWLDTI